MYHVTHGTEVAVMARSRYTSGGALHVRRDLPHPRAPRPLLAHPGLLAPSALGSDNCAMSALEISLGVHTYGDNLTRLGDGGVPGYSIGLLRVSTVCPYSVCAGAAYAMCLLSSR